MTNQEIKDKIVENIIYYLLATNDTERRKKYIGDMVEIAISHGETKGKDYALTI